MADKKDKIKAPAGKAGITDTDRDTRELRPEEANIQLPDVSDIPGQEHVHVPPAGELADTTISSDDEEGKGIFDQSLDTSGDSNVTREERERLAETNESMSTKEDIDLRRAKLDNTDFDGTPLNEREGISGDDLDVPGEELDDANEEIGEEDEENNEYSLGGDRHDNIPNE